ncbi:hypothetical protein ACVWYN_001982 [Pedobacter sp. UYP24]
MATFFYKGKENILEAKKEQDTSEPEQVNLKKIQDSFMKVLDNKNLSFLLGSGCSSYEIETGKPSPNDKIQIGIPVMAPMAKEFYGSEVFKEEKEWLKTKLNFDVESDKFRTNLEAFLSTLHSLSFYHSTIEKDDVKKLVSENIRDKSFSQLTTFERIESIILKARNFFLSKCLNEHNSIVENGTSNDSPLVALYKQFYRKLLTRNPTLPRLSIFTTNYDLYSERAMDLLGVHYVNGFTGGISKFFNPAIFNYALAEKMDLSQSKWNVIDNLFYLYKIHGSVNWIQAEGESKLFKVKEIQDPTLEQLKREDTIMIHPTPLKYNASLGSPYSDLFREFQKKLMQNNNILVTIGYSFNDEHINNLIFQAFTIPSFRLIVIGQPSEENAIGKLQKLSDSRIWIIGGSAEGTLDVPLHHFKRFVEEVLPDLTAEDLDRKMETTINNLKNLLK